MLELNFKFDLPMGKEVSVCGSLEVDQRLAISGPSGCGKTTLLRTLLGFHPLKSGFIRLDDLDFTRALPEQRGFGISFQDPSLLSHLSVLENIQLPLLYKEPFRSETRELRRQRAQDYLSELKISHLAQRFPKSLSGGEAMRVSILRALIFQPKLVLLDEPSAGLDAASKQLLLEWLNAVFCQTRATLVLVTHDEEFARGLATRVCAWEVARSCVEF